MWRLCLFTILIFVSSCAQRMKIPINRMQSPEVIGGGVGLSIRQEGLSIGGLDFGDGDTDNPLVMSSTDGRGMVLDMGVGEMTDLYWRMPNESAGILGLKIQLMGDSLKKGSTGHKMAIAFGKGVERDVYDDSGYKIGLNVDMQDYALIHGYRFSQDLMFYDSFSLMNYEFEGDIKETPQTLSGSSINYNAHSTMGLHLGLIIGTLPFNFMIEFGMQRVSWTNTESATFYSFGYALTAVW